MRSSYRILEENGPYFVTSTVVEWIPLFTSARYCDIITESLRFCRSHKGLSLHAYVIMDNHIHLIITAADVTNLMRDFKSYTSKKVLDLLQRDKKEWLLGRLEFYKKEYKPQSLHQIWQEGFHPELISSDEMLQQKAHYLHNNPLRRGLVLKPEDWVYSSASNYTDGSGVIDVDRLC